MERTEFLEKMQDVLQIDNELTLDTVLESLDEWDSLAMMATVAFLDANFGIKTTFEDFKSMKTVEDIAKKVGI